MQKKTYFFINFYPKGERKVQRFDPDLWRHRIGTHKRQLKTPTMLMKAPAMISTVMSHHSIEI